MRCESDSVCLIVREVPEFSSRNSKSFLGMKLGDAPDRDVGSEESAARGRVLT
jgi:hypothetical protein